MIKLSSLFSVQVIETRSGDKNFNMTEILLFNTQDQNRKVFWTPRGPVVWIVGEKVISGYQKTCVLINSVSNQRPYREPDSKCMICCPRLY